MKDNYYEKWQPTAFVILRSSLNKHRDQYYYLHFTGVEIKAEERDLS